MNCHRVQKQTTFSNFFHSRNHSLSDHVYSHTNNYEEQFNYYPYSHPSCYGQPIYTLRPYHTPQYRNIQDNESTTRSIKASSHQHCQQQQNQQQQQHHHRRKIRKPTKAFFVETDTDPENEEVNVVMETSSQMKNSYVVNYEKKMEVLSVLFPDHALNELKDLFEDFKGDIQGVVEFLFAKRRAYHVKHQQISSSKSNNTCHCIETLISKKSNTPVQGQSS